MSEPLVCAVMLTRDRPELAKRAVECFRAQTYRSKRLLVWDSGHGEPVETTLCPDYDAERYIEDNPYERAASGKLPFSIGELRNRALHDNGAVYWVDAQIYVHWDDDDWSHPRRIEEQVALLQSSGADVVGYREMLFCDERPEQLPDSVYASGMRIRTSVTIRRAWLYSNPDPRYCLGTSLCYWRKTWERKPFEATSRGEDLRFITGLKTVGVISVAGDVPVEGGGLMGAWYRQQDAPRMIARIHAGNTSDAYEPTKMRSKSEWRRVPDWDEYVRGVMQ